MSIFKSFGSTYGSVCRVCHKHHSRDSCELRVGHSWLHPHVGTAPQTKDVQFCHALHNRAFDHLFPLRCQYLMICDVGLKSKTTIHPKAVFKKVGYNKMEWVTPFSR